MKKMLSTILLMLTMNAHAEDIVSRVVKIEPVVITKTVAAQDHNSYEILSEAYRFDVNLEEVQGVKLVTCINETNGKPFRMEVQDAYASTLKVGQRIVAQVTYK